MTKNVAGRNQMRSDPSSRRVAAAQNHHQQQTRRRRQRRSFAISISASATLDRSDLDASSNTAAGATTKNGYNGAAFTIKTYNAISEKGLQRFPEGRYEISGDSDDLSSEAMAIMLRRYEPLSLIYNVCIHISDGCGTVM